jgi:hypothetical protein
MRVLACLAALALVLAPRRAGAQASEEMTLYQAPDSEGACEVFPAGLRKDASDMGSCEALAGANVFIFTSRGTLTEQYNMLVSMTDRTLAMASSVASARCVTEFQSMICNTWFPPVRRLGAFAGGLRGRR